MRVLMSAAATGGVWTYATELRAALGAAGVDVVLATLGHDPPPHDDIAHMACRLEWHPDPWEDVRASGQWLRELAEDERVDIVHLDGYAHAAAAWHVPVVSVAHSCALSWHEAVRGTQADESWDRYRGEVLAGLRKADMVVAPTAAMRCALRRLYGFDRRCRVIANGVAPLPASRLPKQRFVLSAGRLFDEATGLDTLDAAARRIAWPVAVAGDCAGASAQHARLLGRLDRDDLRRRMDRAAIFAHPARYEPFGLAVLEAAQASCALVLGDIPSLREQWDGAALFVAPADDDALAGAIGRLIEDDDLRRELAIAARTRARRDGDAAVMAGAYVDLYERLLQPSRMAA
jgi:glycosyltransferase involved in cell wall biosynthesis